MPKTLAEFEKALATAKAAGETPIAFGNLDKWPGIHEFQSVLMSVAPAAQVGNTIFGKPGSKWSTPAVLKAAATVQKWAKAGYYSDGYAGLGYDDATKNFVKGKGVFTITGTWKTGDMASGLKSNVGPDAPPGRAGRTGSRCARERRPRLGDPGQGEEPGALGDLHQLHHEPRGGKGDSGCRRRARDRRQAEACRGEG